jgi:hypothetical protein
MGGLAKICKLYGGMTTKSKGKSVEWIYDYKLDKPRLKSEMTKKEIAENEKLKNKL